MYLLVKANANMSYAKVRIIYRTTHSYSGSIIFKLLSTINITSREVIMSYTNIGK